MAEGMPAPRAQGRGPVGIGSARESAAAAPQVSAGFCSGGAVGKQSSHWGYQRPVPAGGEVTLGGYPSGHAPLPDHRAGAAVVSSPPSAGSQGTRDVLGGDTSRLTPCRGMGGKKKKKSTPERERKRKSNRKCKKEQRTKKTQTGKQTQREQNCEGPRPPLTGRSPAPPLWEALQ